ncbi:TPA: hypothetical protein N0F65_007289 [Lagenidium giganteum]|uniref:Tetraspanin n=1 Tax=Lagenidium giganteum TaxID=4803 RepID=A0AAV2Z7I5_9STRA|nr:TPA: hypothetical protein N0F65_007289 [Lagenidium giganteum]
MRVWRTLSRGILVFTNVLFLLLGAVLVTLGGYMISIPDLNAFSDGGISSAIITCGSLIVLIALLGCCGAQWDSKVFLFPYAMLVIVSVVAQFALAGFMYHVHGALLKVAALNFDLSVLSAGDRGILKWINHRFAAAYDHCGLSVDLGMSLNDHALVATCRNTEYSWFAAFIENNCRISASDLQPGSTFLSCAGANFSMSDSVTEHTMICACESRMIQWVDDQSLLIAVFVGAVAFFEIVLVFLSCYVMCSRRGRHQGYHEIRMPLKQQPYNPHPRNYYTYGSSQSGDNVSVNNGGHAFGFQPGQQQPLYNNTQPSYAAMGTTTASYPFAKPVNPSQDAMNSKQIYGPSI